MFTKKTIDTINEAFKKVEKDVACYRHVFDEATDDEKICLKFYYAYMPVSDLATYDASLFLRIIRQTLKVKSLNLFNEDIPEEMFLNFVLHYRVNNENIEFHREIFFNELHDRIKGKTMAEAALEVNYWCLEKATYTSTNSRTVSPLTIIRNTKGRCGEESTFTVSALRSVGIPARQIYTPRWAHCDDNHAWVEVFVGGAWHFLGACEPESVLDCGWFEVPASMGMLMHTRVFSSLVSVEEITYGNEKFTELNLTSNYAVTKKLIVKVDNTNDKIVKVCFEIPNYCQFTPLATLETDSSGTVSIITGLGDLHIHVTDGEKYVTRMVDVRKTDSVVIDFHDAVPNQTKSEAVTLRFVPPVGKTLEEAHQSDENHGKILERCTQIRTAFESTFINDESGKKIADEYNGFHKEIITLLKLAKGNHTEIKSFLEAKTVAPLKYKILLLNAIASKDLTDTTKDTLLEHLEHAYQYHECFFEDVFVKYLLNPRIHLEMLFPYRSFINEFFNEADKKAFVENPKTIQDWLDKNIQDDTDYDYKTLIASAVGTLKLGRGSISTKKVLFVSICRSLGIPARFNPVDHELEYYDKDTSDFARIVPYEIKKTVKLTLACEVKLVYRKNFSIARLINGSYQTLLFGDNKTNTFEAEEGYYRILTGERIADGTMLVKEYFVEVNNDVTVAIEIPVDNREMTAIGVPNITIDKNNHDLNGVLPEKYNIFAFVEPAKEPTEHLFKELLQAKTEIIQKGIGVVLVYKTMNKTLEEVIAAFPSIVLLETDDLSPANELFSVLGLTKANYPLQMMVKKNELKALFYCDGYRVGSVNLMLKVIGTESTC